VVVALQQHNDFLKTADEAIRVIEGVGSEWFALRSLVFHEVVAHQKAYVLPFRSGALLAALMTVNGELLLCVSREAALGLPFSRWSTLTWPVMSRDSA